MDLSSLFRRKEEPKQEEISANRLPPGQYLTKKFPVLTYGAVPPFDPKTWRFKIFGLVEKEVQWTWEEFLALPKTSVLADFHCVTTWSRYDNLWEGVSFKEILSRIQVKPEAKFVMQHCLGGYTTNTALETLLDNDVLLAYKHDSKDLEPDHGGPLRMIIPKVYAYKSAKWINGLEFMARNRPGFWEQRGYHNTADPWREERYW